MGNFCPPMWTFELTIMFTLWQWKSNRKPKWHHAFKVNVYLPWTGDITSLLWNCQAVIWVAGPPSRHYPVEGVAELGCSLTEVYSMHFQLPVGLLGYNPIWNPGHSTKYWKHFTKIQLCIMLKLKWEHQRRGKNMEPGTGMTNCVSLRPLTQSNLRMLFCPPSNWWKQKSIISYTLHIEKLPKKSWDLRVDPNGVAYSWTRY